MTPGQTPVIDVFLGRDHGGWRLYVARESWCCRELLVRFVFAREFLAVPIFLRGEGRTANCEVGAPGSQDDRGRSSKRRGAAGDGALSARRTAPPARARRAGSGRRTATREVQPHPRSIRRAAEATQCNPRTAKSSPGYAEDGHRYLRTMPTGNHSAESNAVRCSNPNRRCCRQS